MHVHTPNSLIIESYPVFSITVPIAMEAIHTAYNIFSNENSFSSDARRAAMDRVCLPLLRVCSEQVLRDFFLQNICDIMTILDTRESRVCMPNS